MRLSGAGFGIIARWFAGRKWRIRTVLKMSAQPLFPLPECVFADRSCDRIRRACALAFDQEAI